MKNFPLFEPQIWPEIITSRDAESTCFKGSRTSCREIIFLAFLGQIWPEIITSRDAESTCFKGSRTSCREIIFGIFGANFGQKRSTSRDGCFLPRKVQRRMGKHSFMESPFPPTISTVVYFLSSLRAQTAKTLICTKSGVSADSRKMHKKRGEPHFLRIFYWGFPKDGFCEGGKSQ